MKRQRYGQLTVVAALVLASGVSDAGRGPGGTNPLQGTYDSTETFTYGVCRGVDPSCYHNWGVVHNNSVTIFSRTAAARNGALGDPMVGTTIGPTNVAQAGLKRILQAAGITVSNTAVTESVGSLPGLGNSTAAVIFLDNTGDILWDHGRAVNAGLAVSTTTSAYLDSSKVNLRQYMRSGGGFVAIHDAVGAEPNWYWYKGLVGNASTYDSAATQAGTVKIETSDSSTADIGPAGTGFTITDSFYTLVPYPTEVKFLATVDTNTLATKTAVHPGHGSFHPVAWCQYYDGGRTFVTTLGQDPRLWADLSLPENQPGGASYFPGAAEFQKLIVNGVKSAMGLVPFCT